MKPSFNQLSYEQQKEYGNGCGLTARWLRVPQFIFVASCRHHDFNYERGAGYVGYFKGIFWPLNIFEYIGKGIVYKTKADWDFFRHMLRDAYWSPRPLFYGICSIVYFFGVFLNPIAWVAFSYGRWRSLELIYIRDKMSKSRVIKCKCMSDPITSISVTQLSIHGGMALFGAFVHASQVYRQGGTKSWLDFLVLMLMSSFSGVMFSFVALHLFGESSYLTLAFAGTGGFLGVEGMTYVIDFVKNRFNIKNK